ncbi:hypothetical protein CLU79DRAFT_337688 [Phycomyces nitens]|nr:hypothetical protein CLU79DRAFT_337688 [Phycomyces nitens]
MLNDKPQNLGMVVEIAEEEKETLVGSTCRVKVAVQKVLVASLSLEYENRSNTLILQEFDIHGPREEKSVWQESNHFVFQKINMLAKDAFGDMTTLTAKEALSSILQWLASYHNLFVEPCCRCHKRLQFDSPHYKHLPAVVRTWRWRNNNNKDKKKK